jgi:hypothetical protein
MQNLSLTSASPGWYPIARLPRIFFTRATTL